MATTNTEVDESQNHRLKHTRLMVKYRALCHYNEYLGKVFGETPHDHAGLRGQILEISNVLENEIQDLYQKISDLEEIFDGDLDVPEILT